MLPGELQEQAMAGAPRKSPGDPGHLGGGRTVSTMGSERREDPGHPG